MKLLSLSIAVFCSSLFAAPTAYKVDTAASQIKWVGKKVLGGGQHHGTINVKNGSVALEGDAVKSAEVVADMTSITVVDLEKGSSKNADLTGHLNSDDFFSTAKHPTATFKVAGGKATMTIKGITKPVTIPLTVTKQGDAVSLTGKATLDRTQWNIHYRSNNFFKNLGDKAIADGFDIEVDLKATKG